MIARWVPRGGWLCLGLLAACLSLRPAAGAEVLYFTVGPLLQSLTVDSLTVFAQEGRITGDLERYAPFIGEERLEAMKTVLTKPYPIDPVTVGNLAYTPLGSEFLERLGEIFQTQSGNNGLLALRSALISTAQQPEGFTALGFLQNFPTNMRIDTQSALLFMRDLNEFLAARNRALSAIATQAEQERLASPIDNQPVARPEETWPCSLYPPITHGDEC